MPVRRGPRRAVARTGHRVLPHTADVMLQAWAPSRLACVAEAVRALTDCFARAAPGARSREHAFTVAAASPEAVLVAVLQEAVFLIDARGEVPVGARLSRAGGQVHGVFDVLTRADVHVVGSLPKGVSWSGLSLRRTGRRWRCSAIVDV